MKNNWRSRKKFLELLLGKNGEGFKMLIPC